MEWQDIVLASGSIIFSLALLPTVFSPNKPSWATSLMTGATLYVFAFTYTTLNLGFASITTAISATLWAIIFVQSLLIRSRGKVQQEG